VIASAAAGTIIAVANPALSMSQLPIGHVSQLKTEPSQRVKVEPPASPPASNGRRPAD